MKNTSRYILVISISGLKEKSLFRLGAALRELHGSELAYLEDIPHEVELKHIIRCWNIAVEVEADITRLK